jgi:hypothetical protein
MVVKLVLRNDLAAEAQQKAAESGLQLATWAEQVVAAYLADARCQHRVSPLPNSSRDPLSPPRLHPRV